MPSTQIILVSFFTGALVAAGWCIFVDGAINAPDSFPWFHLVPAFLSMVSLVAINMASVKRIEEPSIKIWFFTWFTISMVCIGVALWITKAEYPAEYNWPGVTIIFQTVLLLFAAILYFIGRINVNESDLFR